MTAHPASSRIINPYLTFALIAAWSGLLLKFVGGEYHLLAVGQELLVLDGAKI